jgi:hypothetical protein
MSGNLRFVAFIVVAAMVTVKPVVLSLALLTVAACAHKADPFVTVDMTPEKRAEPPSPLGVASPRPDRHGLAMKTSPLPRSTTERRWNSSSTPTSHSMRTR